MGRAYVRYRLGCLAVCTLSACSSADDVNGAMQADAESVAPSSAAKAGASADAPAAGTATAEVIPTELGVSSPPAEGKGPFSTSAVALEARGYIESELFVEGPASKYMLSGSETMDGKWTLVENGKAGFKTRILVRRPKDASKFNGTVIVEWLNVSGGVDSDPGYMYNFDLILREGYAWVGVSAQAQGVEGGGFSLTAISGGPTVPPLKMFDAARYGTLKHPGDAYSYDIFSAVAKILREPREIDALEGLKPKHLIAYGESQSAGRLVSYVNGVHPLAKVYDAFFIHSRGTSGAGFEDSPLGGLPIGIGGTAATIRDDIEEKVFQFQTETDVTGMLAFLPARQPDSDKLRTWEVAGTAHADKHLVDFNADNPLGQLDCDSANAGPQWRIIRAALHSLHVWISDGKAPPTGEPLQADASGQSVRDEHGNALGGIRSPDVDVPVATLSGEPPAGGMGFDFICSIFGSTVPFTPEKLAMLYPTHEEYVQKVKASVDAMLKAGFVLEPEASSFIEDAEKAAVPK